MPYLEIRQCAAHPGGRDRMSWCRQRLQGRLRIGIMGCLGNTGFAESQVSEPARVMSCGEQSSTQPYRRPADLLPSPLYAIPPLLLQTNPRYPARGYNGRGTLITQSSNLRGIHHAFHTKTQNLAARRLSRDSERTNQGIGAGR